MEAAAPKQLGRYEVVSLLAQGGMAELYLAKLPGIEGFAKRVVIKRVLPSLARDREFVEMFLEEARLASTLHHQNIVHVHDIGHDSAGYFFAMEYLHGVDVGDIMRTVGDRGVPLPIALEIARGACAGLHYAHERVGANGQPLGIVHRDVSPQNLFVTFDGSAKLLDFGIAKAVQQISNQYTRSGTLRGKLPYMSPEQCQSARIDRRSDVFSIAVVLWEITVGRRLFGTNNASDFEILKSIVEVDAPRPSTIVPGYPPALEQIVMRGLARDRQYRYQTADALQADLEGFMRAQGCWATSRDVATFLRGQFGEQAAASLRIDSAEIAREADIVPFPRSTRPVPEPRPTEDVPPPRPPTAATVPNIPPRRRTWPVVVGALVLAAGALFAGYRLGGSPAPAATGSGSAVAMTPPTTPAPSAPAPTPSPSPAGSNAASVAPVAPPVAPPVTPPAVNPYAPTAEGSAAPAAPAPAAPAPAGGLDPHWFGPNDYLMTNLQIPNGRVNDLLVAQLVSPIDDKGRGTFVTYWQGKQYTVDTFWKTRIAKPNEKFAIGQFAFCKGNQSTTACHAPKTKDDSRTNYWIRGRVTDVSELPAKITVSGCDCDLAGVRVLVE